MATKKNSTPKHLYLVVDETGYVGDQFYVKIKDAQSELADVRDNITGPFFGEPTAAEQKRMAKQSAKCKILVYTLASKLDN